MNCASPRKHAVHATGQPGPTTGASAIPQSTSEVWSLLRFSRPAPGAGGGGGPRFSDPAAKSGSESESQLSSSSLSSNGAWPRGPCNRRSRPRRRTMRSRSRAASCCLASNICMTVRNITIRRCWSSTSRSAAKAAEDLGGVAEAPARSDR